MTFRNDVNFIKQFFINESNSTYANCFDIAYFGEKYNLSSMTHDIDNNSINVWIDKTHYIKFRYSWNEPKIYVDSDLFDTIRLVAKEEAVISIILNSLQYIKSIKDTLFLYEL